MKPRDYAKRAIQYAEDCISGKNIIGEDVINACKRFLADLKREDLEFRAKDADTVCGIMESLLVQIGRASCRERV